MPASCRHLLALGRAFRALVWAAAFTGCVQDPAAVPWREPASASHSLPERNETSLRLAERCADAASEPLQVPQFRERAKARCNRTLKALQLRNRREPGRGQGLGAPLRELRLALDSHQPAQPALRRLKSQLDLAHQANDPKLLTLVRGRDAIWKGAALALRFELRTWRRCIERAQDPSCSSARSRTRAALESFDLSLEGLRAPLPFGTRSLRRCVARRLSQNPDELAAAAQAAQGDQMSLRGCERIARRISAHSA